MQRGIYGIIFALLFVGFMLLFVRVRWAKLLENVIRRSREEMDEAARRRLLENRSRLISLQEKRSFWYRLEQELNYSGWKRKLPFLTAELWLAGNLLGIAVLLPWLAIGGWKRVLTGIVVCGFGEYALLLICKAGENKKVDANLLKFLNFLGNYSITAGELTGIFQQVSKYVDEPLRSVLDECSYEAQTTGDSSLALLAMAEKIEHPQFKELVRNMEISVRYCADFSLLVNSSRRSVREYLRAGEERRGLLREALINMVLLLIMAAAALLVMDGLLESSVWQLLFYTWPGRGALGIVAFILFLFAQKTYQLRQ